MNKLKHILNQQEADIQVNSALKSATLTRLSARPRRFNPWLIYSAASLTLASLAAGAFFLQGNIQPENLNTNNLADTNQLPLSFLQQASAAYHSYTQSLGASEVHHLIVVDDDGTQANSARVETWIRADGAVHYKRKYPGTNTMEYIRVDGKDFVNKSYQAELATQVPVDDSDQVQFFPELPKGAEGSMSVVPLTDHTYQVCAKIDPPRSTDTESALELMNQVMQYIFPRTQTDKPDLAAAIDALSQSAVVKDLGETQHTTFGAVHTFRLSYEDLQADPDQTVTRGVDYIFDVQQLTLKQIHNWYQDPDTVNEGTSNMTWEVDEIVDLNSIDPNIFNPQAYGFIQTDVFQQMQTQHEQARAKEERVTIPENGCFIYDQTTKTLTKEK